MSLDFGIEIDLSELGALREKVMGALGGAFRMMALDLWGNIREEAPVRHGRLAGSWEIEQVDDLDWRIRSAVSYALAVNQGSKPHEIRPRNAKSLRFVVGNQVIFAKRVRHPGTEANPYIDRAISRTEKRIDEFVGRAVSASLG
ncbi:MAG: HK97 gp10 family phage protein [Firmicutes bacterium]|nr:HK97 gp10 family phage protein [Bacillota bacterium]